MSYLSLSYAALASLVLAVPIFSNCGFLAIRFKLLDFPSARKKHANPIPIVGGICIFLIWTIAMAMYAFLAPSWTSNDSRSLLVIGAGIWCLVALGISDDVWTLPPKFKLLIQIGVTIFTLTLEPNLRESITLKSSGLNNIQSFLLIYIPAAVWILGVTNAINLIDGIDGFAAGTALLITLSCIGMQMLPGAGNSFALVSMTLLIIPLVLFLTKNWAPAKIFLGDNGSLPLGYLLAFSALIHRKDPNLLVGIPTLLIMHAYPILDMGLCVFRRFRNGYPIFKADRNHLHHRIQRFGLNHAKTTGFLLCIVTYCQMTAVFLSAVHFHLMVITTISFVLSLFIFLYLLDVMESWRSTHILKEINSKEISAFKIDPKLMKSAIEINLSPLLEVGSFEESEKIQVLVASLQFLVQKNIRKQDYAFLQGKCLYIIPAETAGAPCRKDKIVKRIDERLLQFQNLFDIQYAIDGLPVGETSFQHAKATEITEFAA